MAKKNFYAVKVGKITGIFKTWEECKASVDGYSGAKYKGFAKKEEAEEYLGIGTAIKKNHKTTKKEITIPDGTILAYVDGSYNKDRNIYGSGVFLLSNDEEKEISESGNEPAMLDMWNVAGEVYASMLAINYAINAGYHKIIIYHDYTGIAGWVNGYSTNGKPSKIWNANEEGAKIYKNFGAEAKRSIEIDFVKVKAHSGDMYNNRADKLAKLAAQIN
jgi:ribonuclease HI